ncbi:hypothetical protein AB0C02_30115 [Micromonospora sp. NPDC048999]|uniref:hypothetical protein n=1 Tax=Micromonospora sp. NPDC048999 TaxID=3155391 RepID=UPI00340F2B36
MAADGARSDICRRLGIPMPNPTGVSHNLNILFDGAPPSRPTRSSKRHVTATTGVMAGHRQSMA